MRIITILFCTLFFIKFSYSQINNNVLFDERVQTNKFHSINDLEDLKKGDLLKLYIIRIREIQSVLPFMALTKEAGVTLSDLGIRENSDNIKMLDKYHETDKEAFFTTSDMMTEFVAYADTEKIILSILYFEEIIKKLRIGIDEDY